MTGAAPCARAFAWALVGLGLAASPALAAGAVAFEVPEVPRWSPLPAGDPASAAAPPDVHSLLAGVLLPPLDVAGALADPALAIRGEPEPEEAEARRWSGEAPLPRDTLHPVRYSGTPNWWTAAFPVDPSGAGDLSYVVASWDGVFERYDRDGRLRWNVATEDLARQVPRYAFNQTMIAYGPWGFGVPGTQDLPVVLPRTAGSDLLLAALVVTQRDPARLSTLLAALDTADGAVAWSRVEPGIVRHAVAVPGDRVAIAVETGANYTVGRHRVGDDATSRVELLESATGRVLAVHDTGVSWGAIWGFDADVSADAARLYFTVTGALPGFLASPLGAGPGVAATLVALAPGPDGLEPLLSRELDHAPSWLDAGPDYLLWRGVIPAERLDEARVLTGSLTPSGAVRWEHERPGAFLSPTAGVGDLDGDGRPDLAGISFQPVGNEATDLLWEALELPAVTGSGPGHLLVVSGATGAILVEEDLPYTGVAVLEGDPALLLLAGGGRVVALARGVEGFETAWETPVQAATYHLPIDSAPDGTRLLALADWTDPRLILLDAAEGGVVAERPTSDLVYAAAPYEHPRLAGAEILVGGLRGDLRLILESGRPLWRIPLDSTVREIVPLSPGDHRFLAVTDHQVYGIDAERGRVLWEGPMQTPAGTQWYASAFADLNGDGARDAVVSEFGFTVPDVRWTVAVDGATGSALWKTPLPGTRGAVALDARDLSGDGVADVAMALRYDVGQFGTLFALDGRDGAILWQRAADEGSSPNARQRSLRIVDFAGDGAPEVAVVTWDSHYYVLDGRDGRTLGYHAVEGFEPVTFDALAVPKGLDASTGAEQLAVLGRMEGDRWGTVGVVDAEGVTKWTFTSPIPAFTYSMATGDVDGDGRPDLAVASGDGVYGVLGSRVGRLEGRVDLLFTHASATRIWMVDTDGNGRDEVLFAQDRSLVPGPVLLFATIDLRTAKGVGLLEYDPGRGVAPESADAPTVRGSPGFALLPVLLVVATLAACHAGRGRRRD